jgi:hypothetical protein
MTLEALRHLPQFLSLEGSMSPFRYVLALGVVALIAALSSWSVSAQDDKGDWRDSSQEIKHVFVIALENHN